MSDFTAASDAPLSAHSSLPPTLPAVPVDADERSRERRLLAEFCGLRAHIPSGIYVTPSKESIFVWHGVIFVRNGLWRGGVFKFSIFAPSDYPRSAPTVRFTTTPLFHPQIDPVTQVVSLNFHEGWNGEKCNMIVVLVQLKRLFYERDPESAVGESADEATRASQAFRRKAEQCARKSAENPFEGAAPGSFFQFSPWRQEYDKSLQTALRKSGDSASETGASEGLLSWLDTLKNAWQ